MESYSIIASSAAIPLGLGSILLFCLCWKKQKSLIIQDPKDKKCRNSKENLNLFQSNHCINPFLPASLFAASSGLSSPNSPVLQDIKSNQCDLAYATTIGLANTLDDPQMSRPFTILRQESNSHRSCELPPVPSLPDAHCSISASNQILPEVPSENPGSNYYALPVPSSRTVDKPEFYAVPADFQLRHPKRRSTPHESDVRYSFCDDPASDSDGLYASVSHSVRFLDTRPSNHSLLETSLKHNEGLPTTNSNTEAARHSHYYSQLNPRESPAYYGELPVDNALVRSKPTQTANHIELQDNHKTVNYCPSHLYARVEPHSSSLSHSPRNVLRIHHMNKPTNEDLDCMDSVGTPDRIGVDDVVRAQSTEVEKFSDIYDSGNTSVYVSGPPIPERSYDQKEIDLVNFTRVHHVGSGMANADMTTVPCTLDFLGHLYKDQTDQTHRIPNLSDSNSRKTNTSANPLSNMETSLCSPSLIDESVAGNDSVTTDYERVYGYASELNLSNLTTNSDQTITQSSYLNSSSNTNPTARKSEFPCQPSDPCSNRASYCLVNADSSSDYEFPRSKSIQNHCQTMPHHHSGSDHQGCHPLVEPLLISTTSNSNFDPKPALSSGSRILDEMQAFRHMDSELDLTQLRTYPGHNTEHEHSGLGKNSHHHQHDHCIHSTRSLEHSSTHATTTNKYPVDSTHSLNHPTVLEMAPLMERSSEDHSLITVPRSTCSSLVSANDSNRLVDDLTKPNQSYNHHSCYHHSHHQHHGFNNELTPAPVAQLELVLSSTDLSTYDDLDFSNQ